MEEKGYWLCENGHEEPIGTAFAGIELELSRDCSTCHKPMKMIRRDSMTGQERYESDKERKEAERVSAEKRAMAAQEAKNATTGEQTATTLRNMATNSRAFADKIRSI